MIRKHLVINEIWIAEIPTNKRFDMIRKVLNCRKVSKLERWGIDIGIGGNPMVNEQ